MNKLSTFVFGTALGASLMFVGLKYYIIRATDGFHMVPKSSATLATAFVDVRDYTAVDWKERLELATDIANSDNDELKEEVTESAMSNSIDSMFENWNPPTQ